MQNDDYAEEWGSQSWLRPARAHQKSRLKRRLRAGLPAPQSSIAATKTGPTWASAADQGVRPTNRRRLQRFSGPEGNNRAHRDLAMSSFIISFVPA
jgi:hypothetical protein